MTTRPSNSPIHYPSVTQAGFSKESKMNTNLSSKKKSVRAGGLSFAMTVVIGLVGAAGTFAPRPAQAFAFVCANCSNWMTQIPEYGAKIAHYGKELSAWRQQIAGMQAQIASIQNMFMTLGIQPGPQMDEVPRNYNVPQRCGGISLSTLTTVFNVNGSGDIYQQQKQVCANIQMMQNDKYNETVRFLRDSYQAVQTDFNMLRQKQASATNVGDSNKVAQDADAAIYKQKARYDDWQSRMIAYDGYIATMRENQKLLAQTALKGSKTNQVLGQIGKTAILVGALEVD